MFRFTEQNRQNPGRVSTFQIRRGVADHPDSMIRGNSRAVEGPENRVGSRLVPCTIPGADRPFDPLPPAEMGEFRPQIVTHLVAYDCDVEPRLAATREQGIGAAHTGGTNG